MSEVLKFYKNKVILNVSEDGNTVQLNRPYWTYLQPLKTYVFPQKLIMKGFQASLKMIKIKNSSPRNENNSGGGKSIKRVHIESFHVCKILENVNYFILLERRTLWLGEKRGTDFKR